MTALRHRFISLGLRVALWFILYSYRVQCHTTILEYLVCGIPPVMNVGIDSTVYLFVPLVILCIQM